MIYLLGGSGYVGQAYQALFRRKGIEFRNLVRSELDYADPAVLAAALRADRPEFLINAAGYTGKPNVDAGETQKSECILGNVLLPRMVELACAEAGVPWGHVSSGCIYTGSRSDGAGFTEEDPPNFSFRHNNCSFYSGTKALAEELLAGKPDLYLWRLRIPFEYTDNKRNYLTKMITYPRLLDVPNSVSQLQEFVEATFTCWEKRVPFGTYNVTNPGVITTREVVELLRQSGVLQHEVSYFASEEEFNQTVKAPRSSCVLDSGKLASAGIHMTEVHEAVARDLANWQPDPELVAERAQAQGS